MEIFIVFQFLPDFLSTKVEPETIYSWISQALKYKHERLRKDIEVFLE